MKCAICGTEKYLSLYQLKNFSIKKCSNCGLAKTFGKQSVSYENYYRDTDYIKYDKYFENIFKKRFNIISKFKSKGRVLEIGSSTGLLLNIFKDNGWESWGVDPSKSSDIARKRGLKIIKSNLEDTKLPKDYFDVVILNHTLEHVSDPVQVLLLIGKTLKSNGIVYIDVPNFGSLSSQIAGKSWKYLLPNEHVYHFTNNTIELCITKAGYKKVWSKTWSGIFDVANPFEKLIFKLLNLQKSFFTDLIEIPGNLIATMMNKGTNLAIIIKK